jgi:hypothetical protein
LLCGGTSTLTNVLLQHDSYFLICLCFVCVPACVYADVGMYAYMYTCIHELMWVWVWMQMHPRCWHMSAVHMSAVQSPFLFHSHKWAIQYDYEGWVSIVWCPDKYMPCICHIFSKWHTHTCLHKHTFQTHFCTCIHTFLDAYCQGWKVGAYECVAHPSNVWGCGACRERERIIFITHCKMQWTIMDDFWRLQHQYDEDYQHMMEHHYQRCSIMRFAPELNWSAEGAERGLQRQ